MLKTERILNACFELLNNSVDSNDVADELNSLIFNNIACNFL